VGRFQESLIYIGVPCDISRFITNADREHERPAIRNDHNIHQCLPEPCVPGAISTTGYFRSCNSAYRSTELGSLGLEVVINYGRHLIFSSFILPYSLCIP